MLVLSSSNMQQARSKKLMVSLCGLALSSVFLINNKAVVHADSVDGSQNNAITWDSDQDDSQVVSDTQTKTEQAIPKKADDNQQNATQPVQNSAEMSTVRSSSEQRPLTNQTKDVEISSATDNQNSRANLVSNVDDAQNAPVQAKQKVANVQDAQAVNPVVIKNPAGNKVHVNWVNSKGEAIPNVNGYDIDLTKVGTQSEYHFPNSYHLIKNGNFSVTKNTHNIHHDAVTHQKKYQTGTIKTGTIHRRGVNTHTKYGSPYPVYKITDEQMKTFVKEGLISGAGTYKWKMYNLSGTPNGDYFEINGRSLLRSDSRLYSELFYELAPYGIDLDGSIKGTMNIKETPEYSYRTVTESPAYDETITDGYTFTDNSGNVLKQSGNTIDVGLIRPQHVDPATDTRMKATATRTIQINFPGQVPLSYKNIVNDKGVLTQTVTFTRTGQEDALTGNLIDSTLTPWKSNNQDPNFLGFSERTLPRIPGYTLKITPVQA